MWCNCLDCPLDVTTAAGWAGGGGGGGWVYLVLDSWTLLGVFDEADMLAVTAVSCVPSQPTFLGQSQVCSSWLQVIKYIWHIKIIISYN